MDHLTPDQRLGRHGRNRHRVIDRRGLHEIGITDRMIRVRERRGQLHPLWRGVWSIGSPHLTDEGRCLAGALAVGRDAVVSHRSAAGLWGIRDLGFGDIEVSVPRDLPDRRGLDIHWSRTLRDGEVVLRRGVPVTSVPRTLLDLADVLGLQALEEAIDRALSRRLLLGPPMQRTLDAAVGRHGVPALRAALGLTLTRSELERLFLRHVVRWELPAPATNVRLGGWEVDCWWPDRRVAVELDGWRFHRTRRSFEADHDRDLEFRAHGIHILRLTYRQLTRRTEWVGAALRRELVDEFLGRS